jgi:hypothetical protein
MRWREDGGPTFLLNVATAVKLFQLFQQARSVVLCGTETIETLCDAVLKPRRHIYQVLPKVMVPLVIDGLDRTMPNHQSTGKAAEVMKNSELTASKTDETHKVRNIGVHSFIDQREERLFRALDDDNDDVVTAGDLERTLGEVGLFRDDKRLAESMAAIEEILRPDPKLAEERLRLRKSDFCYAIRHNILLIERALQGRMVIPDFAGFKVEVPGYMKMSVRTGRADRLTISRS